MKPNPRYDEVMIVNPHDPRFTNQQIKLMRFHGSPVGYYGEAPEMGYYGEPEMGYYAGFVAASRIASSLANVAFRAANACCSCTSSARI